MRATQETVFRVIPIYVPSRDCPRGTNAEGLGVALRHWRNSTDGLRVHLQVAAGKPKLLAYFTQVTGRTPVSARSMGKAGTWSSNCLTRTNDQATAVRRVLCGRSINGRADNLSHLERT